MNTKDEWSENVRIFVGDREFEGVMTMIYSANEACELEAASRMMHDAISQEMRIRQLGLQMVEDLQEAGYTPDEMLEIIALAKAKFRRINTL